MYQFGSTTGPAQYPLYEKPGGKIRFSMLPRPVTKCRPGELGQIWLSHTPWLRALPHEVSIMTRMFLSDIKLHSCKDCLKKMMIVYTLFILVYEYVIHFSLNWFWWVVSLGTTK